MYRITNGAKGTNLIGVYNVIDEMTNDVEKLSGEENCRYILLKVSDKEDTVDDVLKILQIDLSSEAGKFIRDAVNEGLDKPLVMDSITTFLYPYLAYKYNCKEYTVERNIRFAIEKTWKKIPMDVKKRIFGNFAYEETRPSNRNYINSIVRYLR